MKVGILTFQFAYNYGAVLQCFGLQRALEELGVDVEVIHYRPHPPPPGILLPGLGYHVRPVCSKLPKPVERPRHAPGL